jgi:hypothetical protein
LEKLENGWMEASALVDAVAMVKALHRREFIEGRVEKWRADIGSLNVIGSGFTRA